MGLKIRIIKTCLLPQIDYGNGLYVGLPQVQIRKLQRLLNAAVRFIFKLRRFDRVSISSYAKKCHFLPVQYRINYKICTLAYKSINDLAPDYLKDLIQIKSSLECLRINNDKFLLYVPSPEKICYKNRGFSSSAPLIWNCLPYDIRSCASISLFKSKLKTHYFSCAYNTIWKNIVHYCLYNDLLFRKTREPCMSTFMYFLYFLTVLDKLWV